MMSDADILTILARALKTLGYDEVCSDNLFAITKKSLSTGKWAIKADLADISPETQPAIISGIIGLAALQVAKSSEQKQAAAAQLRKAAAQAAVA